MSVFVSGVERWRRGAEGRQRVGENAQAEGEFEGIGALAIHGRRRMRGTGQRLGYAAGPHLAERAQPLGCLVAANHVEWLNAGAGKADHVVPEFVQECDAGIFFLGHGESSPRYDRENRMRWYWQKA